MNPDFFFESAQQVSVSVFWGFPSYVIGGSEMRLHPTPCETMTRHLGDPPHRESIRTRTNPGPK